VKVRVVRVFADDRGRFGNPLGIVVSVDQPRDSAGRLSVARELGYSETAFLDDVDQAAVSFYSGRREVPFAGHAAVGVAWLLRKLTGSAPELLRTASGGEVPSWVSGGATWVRSALATTPAWWHERLDSPETIEALRGPLSPVQDMTQVWAWLNEAEGSMRVRTFASRAGIEEDEACGSGAMRMAAAFGRPLTLHHGRGSVIYAQPGPSGYADIGGRVVEDDHRTIG
jgi:predicted PhzF superfamily epimerase YddE/YHI9